MKIISTPRNIVRLGENGILGHDGIDYFFVRTGSRKPVFGENADFFNITLLFKYLHNNELFARHEVPSPGNFFFYHNPIGDYETKTWKLSHSYQLASDVVSNGQIVQIPDDSEEEEPDNCLPLCSTQSPRWCIIFPMYIHNSFTAFCETLKYIGENRLYSLFSGLQEQELLIIDRETGESNKLSIPFKAHHDLVIALDEQTVAVCGSKQIAIIDLDF